MCTYFQLNSRMSPQVTSHYWNLWVEFLCSCWHREYFQGIYFCGRSPTDGRTWQLASAAPLSFWSTLFDPSSGPAVSGMPSHHTRHIQVWRRRYRVHEGSKSIQCATCWEWIQCSDDLTPSGVCGHYSYCHCTCIVHWFCTWWDVSLWWYLDSCSWPRTICTRAVASGSVGPGDVAMVSLGCQRPLLILLLWVASFASSVSWTRSPLCCHYVEQTT